MTARTKPAEPKDHSSGEAKTARLQEKKRLCVEAISDLTRKGKYASLSQIEKHTSLSLGHIAQALTLLEMEGLILAHPGGEYSLVTLKASADYLAPNNSLPDPAPEISDQDRDMVWNVLGMGGKPPRPPMDAAAIAVLAHLSTEAARSILGEMVEQGIVEETPPPTTAPTTLGDCLQPGYSASVRYGPGRRLDIITCAAEPEQTAPPPGPSQFTTEIELSRITRSPLNVRKSFGDEALDDLASSISRTGLLAPIIVRPQAAGYEVVAGERRYRAALRAGLTHIRADILDLSDEEALEINITENLCREDLNPIEVAWSYRRRLDLGKTQQEVAALTGHSQPVIANALRLLDLPAEVQDLIASGALTVTHGTLLASYSKFPLVASALARLAVELQWPSDQLKGQPHKDHLYEINRIYDSPVLVDLKSYLTKFDTTVCKSCRFHACRAGICLYPAHYNELNEAAIAERKARQEELLGAPVPAIEEDAPVMTGDLTADVGESVIAIQPIFTPAPGWRPETSAPSPEPLPAPDPTTEPLSPPAPSVSNVPISLAALDFDQYELTDRKFDVVEGCGPDCPCLRPAIDENGASRSICVDPSRRSMLRDAAHREKVEAREAAFAAKLAAVHHAIDASPYACAVLLASLALTDVDFDCITAACERHAAPDLASSIEAAMVKPQSPYCNLLTPPQWYHVLSASNLPARLLTVIAAEAVLTQDAAALKSEYHEYETPLADLVCTDLPTDPEANAPSPIPRPTASEKDLRQQVKELKSEIAQLRRDASEERVDPTTTLIYRNLQSDRDRLHLELTRLKTENLALRSSNGNGFHPTREAVEAAK